MKRFILLFALSAGIPFCAVAQEPASGQEAAQSQSQAQTPAAPASGTETSVQPGAPSVPPTASGVPAGASGMPAEGASSGSLEQPISLIPQTLPEKSPKPSYEESVLKDSEQKLKKTIEEFGIDKTKNRIRYREVKTKALLDDKIQAEMVTAQAAKTDNEKRAALTRYYNLLFDRMIALDPSLKEDVERQRGKYLNRYIQHRVRPAGVPAELESQ